MTTHTIRYCANGDTIENGRHVSFRPPDSIAKGFAFVPESRLGDDKWSVCMRERNRITYTAYSVDCLRRRVNPIPFKECVR